MMSKVLDHELQLSKALGERGRARREEEEVML